MSMVDRATGCQFIGSRNSEQLVSQCGGIPIFVQDGRPTLPTDGERDPAPAIGTSALVIPWKCGCTPSWLELEKGAEVPFPLHRTVAATFAAAVVIWSHYGCG
ncbi:hypothetical protein [Nocardia sp. NPDC049526]|uniref:hypothetical protein n=1 Tax=Nocardia sp. NPDC049526 TaxID=3364316 RepID=UPI00379C86D6